MKFLDLKAQYKSIKKEIDAAIKRVLDSCVFIGGAEVEGLEKEVAGFCGTKYAIGVNSGTDALFLSLKALGIKEGDEVITTPFTFIATAEIIANLGARPVFVDIAPGTFNIDILKIEKIIADLSSSRRKKLKAIIPVHIFGQMADMDEIMKIAKKYRLSVVEDSAQAMGAEYKGRKAGSMGDLGCLSFFPSKNLGAYGDGGMIITSDKDLADKINLFKSHGSSPKEKYLNLVLGTNSRLDALQAAILRAKLKHLSVWSKERAKKASYYNKFLKRIGDVKISAVDKNKTHIFHQYTVRTKFRDKLQKYLNEKGIPTMIYYPLPLHLQPAFKYLGYKRGDFPESEKAASEVLSLPIYPEIGRKDQDYIIQKIKEFYEKEN